MMVLTLNEKGLSDPNSNFFKCFSAILYILGMFVIAAESGLLMQRASCYLERCPDR